MDISGKLDGYLKQPFVSTNLLDERSSSSSIQFSLPKIKLPEFDGKATDWRSFIALFDRMVHNNRQIDSGLKIEYLKTSIKGKALESFVIPRQKIIKHVTNY